MDYSAINQGGFEDPEHNPHASSPESSTHFAPPSFSGMPASDSPFGHHGIGDETPILQDHHGFGDHHDDHEHEHEHDPHRAPPSPQQAYDHGQHQQENQQEDQPGSPAIQQQPQQHLHPGPNYRPQPQQRTSSKNIRTQQQKPLVQYKLLAKITGLERTGRKDPILRFDVHTNLPKFRTTQFRDVRRTHPEFVKLAQHLISANPECFVPAVPPPSTAAGVGTEEDETRVRGSMQRWLNYVCSNEVLMRDEEMVFFVESDFGYSPVMRKKQPATGVRRKMLKQFAPPPDDTVELAEARPIVKAFYLATMECGHKVDRVVKVRRGLALAESDLGVKMTQLSDPALTTHTGLGIALRKLGKTVQSVGDQAAAQATAEATTLSDAYQYHSSDAFIVKETLTNRQILMRDLLTAQATTRSRLQSADRLKSSSSVRRDKVDEAIASLDEARSHETHLQAKVNRVTSNLLVEQRRWFSRTAFDLRASIRDYTLRQIEAERRALATLETVRPDIRNIDSSGGLSRLGRDVPPAARRASLAASQGPRGDAWSGAARSQAPGINRTSVVGNMVVTPGVAAANGGQIDEEDDEDSQGGTARLAKSAVLVDEGEDDRVDARNAANRLAASTF